MTSPFDQREAAKYMNACVKLGLKPPNRDEYQALWDLHGGPPPKPAPPPTDHNPNYRLVQYQEENRPTLDQIFKKNLPDTMYYSHYDLAKMYENGYTPQEWRTYLRDNALFIETELAAIAEAEARSALSRLGNASGQEVQALKAILEKSKLINDAQKQQTRILMTFIPQSTEKESSHDKRSHDSENMQRFSRTFDREE